MKITDMLTGTDPVVSFEFFPPKTTEGTEKLYRTIESLKTCRPSFVSITCGAGGGTQGRTLDLVERIQCELEFETMAHVTCVGVARKAVREQLVRLRGAGIENVLALRGDPPRGESCFQKPKDGFAHANELIQLIRDEGFQFCIGAACYPEKHPESLSFERDLEMTRLKVAAGADFLISQLFFDNDEFFAFIRRARGAGIRVPILPGIMPITNVKQVERFTSMCGARVPQELRRRLEIVKRDPAAVVASGVHWSIRQCKGLQRHGIAGVHFYTLNESSATLAVHAALGY